MLAVRKRPNPGLCIFKCLNHKDHKFIVAIKNKWKQIANTLGTLISLLKKKIHVVLLNVDIVLFTA